MEKEFIPYEQALALKQLGFDEPCFMQYDKNGLVENVFGRFRNSYFNLADQVSAPTFSQSFKFLREKYNLIFQINYLFNGNYQVVIHKNTHEYMVLIQDLKAACVYEIPDNYSYEEAELACLNKLIEIVK